MRELLSGGLAAGSLVVALFFLKHWRRTGDRLFACFAGSFGLMGANGVALALTDPDDEFRFLLYGVRLVAFLVILYAIFDKNRSSAG